MQSKVYLVFFLILSLLISGVSAAVTQYNLTVGTETVWIFNGTGTLNNINIPSNGTAHVLIVGGGASGGSGITGSLNGGGGGGGGVLNGTITNLTSNTSITVGSPGAARSSQQLYGQDGGASKLNNWTAEGGGGGAQSGTATNYAGQSGGNGGGGAKSGGTGGSKTQTSQSPLTGYGENGGTNNAEGQGAGGGGATQEGSPNYGTYAAGFTSTITGVSGIYGRGGSGPGTYTGVSGSGNGGDSQDDQSFAGGSGIVIIRFTTTTIPPSASFVFTLTDTSTGSTSWDWYVTNLTGNNTEILFSSIQNPTITLGIGNWLVKLKSSNAGGSSNSTTKTIGINLTSPVVYFWNRTS